MAFTVEDGTGLIDANAYVDVAYTDSYFLDRGNAVWAAATTEEKETAIIKATDYIEIRWGSLFLGRAEFPETPQALSFPRVNLHDRNGYWVSGIPSNLKKATAEYALRALTDALLPDTVTEDNGLIVASKTEKVGPIEERTSYQIGVPRILRSYPTADRLLREYVTVSGRNYR